MKIWIRLDELLQIKIGRMKMRWTLENLSLENEYDDKNYFQDISELVKMES